MELINDCFMAGLKFRRSSTEMFCLRAACNSA